MGFLTQDVVFPNHVNAEFTVKGVKPFKKCGNSYVLCALVTLPGAVCGLFFLQEPSWAASAFFYMLSHMSYTALNY